MLTSRSRGIDGRAVTRTSQAGRIFDTDPMVRHDRLRVLFLCTGNSARSQMAEAILRQLSKGRADVFSAGSLPAQAIHPAAKAVLEETFGIDTSGLVPKSMAEFFGHRFDYVITVCDNAAEQCPVFPGDPQRIHWSFEDPALQPTPEAQRSAAEQVATGLTERLRIWMSLPEVQTNLETESRGTDR